MMDTSWLRQIAPTVATALGGPLAGLAVEAVSKAIGIEPEQTQALLESGKLSSEQIAQIRLAELDLQKQANSLGLDFEKLAVDDRKSARDMLKATGSYIPAVLTIGITVGYFVVLLGMMLKQFTVADSQVMLMMLGQLGTAWGVTIAFWFGTTKNSQEKTNLLANSTPAK